MWWPEHGLSLLYVKKYVQEYTRSYILNVKGQVLQREDTIDRMHHRASFSTSYSRSRP